MKKIVTFLLVSQTIPSSWLAFGFVWHSWLWSNRF